MGEERGRREEGRNGGKKGEKLEEKGKEGKLQVHYGLHRWVTGMEEEGGRRKEWRNGKKKGENKKGREKKVNYMYSIVWTGEMQVWKEEKEEEEGIKKC